MLMKEKGISDQLLIACFWTLGFFQNEDIVIQLDELDELDKISCAWRKCNLKLSTSTDDSVV